MGGSLSPLLWQGGRELSFSAVDCLWCCRNRRSCFAGAPAVFHSTPAMERLHPALASSCFLGSPFAAWGRFSQTQLLEGEQCLSGPFCSSERFAVSSSSGSIQNVQSGRWVPLPLLNTTVLSQWERLFENCVAVLCDEIQWKFKKKDQTFEHFKFSFLVFYYWNRRHMGVDSRK